MDRKYQVNGLKKLCDYLERFIISMKQFEINKNKDNTKNKKKKWLIVIIVLVVIGIVILGCYLFKLKKIDKVPPVIELYNDTIEITEGGEYSLSDNVKSVEDHIDGDITKEDKVPNETGIAYYFIDSSKLDTSKVGEYSVKVIARDKAGNESIKEFIVKVNAKNNENSSSSSTDHNNSSKSDNNNFEISSKDNTSSSSKNNATSNSNKENAYSKNNNSGTSSNIDNKSEQTCTTVWVQDSAAWDETIVDKEAWDEKVAIATVYVCNGCGQEFLSKDDWWKHAMTHLGQGDDKHGSNHTYMQYKTIHHDAVTHVVHHEAIGHNEQKCN